MKFTVHVMPPPRLRPPATAAHENSSPFQAIAPAHPSKPLSTLSFPIDSELPLKNLWKVTEQRFREICDKEKLAGMYFSHMQDLNGGSLFMTDKIGALYPENGPAAERQLFMYMQNVQDGDREGTIAAGSDLRPKDFKKRRWADLGDAEQASVKRRRQEEERYGTTIDELDPDTPVMSREAGNGDAAREDSASREEPAERNRVDAQGFKIPARPTKRIRMPKPSAVHRSPVVLVHSSQDLPTPESTDRHLSDDTPNPTPPSAQRAPESPDADDIVASSQGSQTIFNVLGKRRGGSSSQKSSAKKITWSPAQDDILRQGYKEGWGAQKISQVLGGRSEGAVRARKKLLLAQGKLFVRHESTSQGSQTLELPSSPPGASGSSAPRSSVVVASQSSAPQSSPCEAATLAKEQPSITPTAQKRKKRSSEKRQIAWVQPSPPRKPKKKLSPPVPTLSPEPVSQPAEEPEFGSETETQHEAVIAHVAEPEIQPLVKQHSNGQTATPPESVPSETSAGKLRAPRGGASAAARLRVSRSRVRNTYKEPRARQAEAVPAKAVVSEVHEASTLSEATPFRQDVPRQAELDHVENVVPEIQEDQVDMSEASEVSEQRARKVKAVRKNAVASEVPKVAIPPEVPDPPNVTRVQKTVEVPVLPEDQPTLQAPGRTEVNRVELDYRALDQAIPEITLPQRKKNSIYNNRTDKQRWNEALELAKGDKIRARHIFVVELNKEDMLDAVASDDKQEIERLKAQRRRRERELAISKGLPSPRRRVPRSFSSVSVSKMTIEDVDEEVIREDDWSTDDEERLKKSREEDHKEDNEDEDAIFTDGEEVVDVEAQVKGPRVEEVSQTPPPMVTQWTPRPSSSPANEKGPHPLPAPVKKTAPPPAAAPANEETQPPPPLPTKEKTPLPPAAAVAASVAGQTNMKPKNKPPPPASATSDITEKQKKKKKQRRRSRPSDVSSSRRDSSSVAPSSVRRDSSVPAAPSSSMGPPKTKTAPLPKRKIADPPKKRLTREEAVAAHLAECRRKEEMYLNNDDDDDDDDSSVASST